MAIKKRTLARPRSLRATTRAQRTKQKNKSQRRSGAEEHAMKGHATKVGQQQCEVCRKLLDILLCRNEHSKIVFEDLKQLSDRSKCKVHYELFVDHLGLEKNQYVKRVEVYRAPNRKIIQLNAIVGKDQTGHPMETTLPSRGWGLVSHSTLKEGDDRIGLVDSEWINQNQIRRWKERCDAEHTERCRNFYRVGKLASMRPQWLIDCWQGCLVPAKESDSYVALSYVWGGIKMFNTLKENLEDVQKPGTLLSSEIHSRLPASIRHTIALVSVLRERYLWVDSLCIVQDDDGSKHKEIQNMAGIFNNAVLTVVLGYDNADYGIPGLRGISGPRKYTQKLFRLGKGYQMTEAFWSLQSYGKDSWSKRAWTFQESLLSSRRLTFQDESVHWNCYCSHRWFEDFESRSMDWSYLEEAEFRRAIYEPFPDMCRLAEMIVVYNDRSLTYSEDAHDAFSGILSALNASFDRGFIFGLPLVNLDMGLLWQPSSNSTMTIRDRHNSNSPLLPTWSWVGWHGSIDPWSWYKANDYVKKTPQGWSLEGAHVTERVVPLFDWTVYQVGSQGQPVPISIPNLWLGAREKFLIEGSDDIPSGWTRSGFVYHPLAFNGKYYRPDHQKMPIWVYRHESYPQAEFWYPIPLPSDQSPTENARYLPMISCLTERIILYGAEKVADYAKSTIALRDQMGAWAGCLQLHEPITEAEPGNDDVLGPRNHNKFGAAFELARISIGYNYENLDSNNTLAEWRCPERPRSDGTAYVYYNVLYISRVDHYATRHGIGRVERKMWDKQEQIAFGLTLV